VDNNPLRFAPIIRVSTEKQAMQGESLRTQKKQIIKCVDQWGGTIPDHCWQYSGQEHATPEWERKKLDKLLADSDKDLFDAVICIDASRWSRDNRKSREGLDILRRNGIQFFVGTTEYDLYNPEHTFYLGISGELNEFQAKQQSLKSVLNRIEMAKRGIPVAGRLPSGRTFDKKTEKWGIDREYQKKIELAADMYLDGHGLKNIAKMLKISRTNLRKTLLERCGDKTTVTFDVPRFKIYESISIKIPPLLPQDTIDAIKAKMEANKTVHHAFIKNRYLMSRAILCGHCLRALYGDTRGANQYYVHPKKTDCKHFSKVPAAFIEDAVMVHLFTFFGNKSAMEEAIKSAVPDYSEIEKLKIHKIEMEQEIKKIQTAKDRLLDLAEKGAILESDIKERMTINREREYLLNAEIDSINTKLENVPSEKVIKRKADLLKCTIESIYSSGLEFSRMSFEEKRKLIQIAFSGRDHDGSRAGVYIKKDGAAEWSFTIKGVFSGATISDYLPMQGWKANGMLGIEDDNFDPFSRSELKSLNSGWKPLPQILTIRTIASTFTAE
jgi:DNA invertase Pin-like site-specific DNA recombinase